MEAFRHLDLLIPEQVIEVPMISSSRRRCRRRRLPVQQMAEQLVEVPEFVSVAHAIHRQIADFPIPQVGGLFSGGVQGFLPGQDYIIEEVSSRTLTFQFRRVVGGMVEVFKGFSQCRIQQRIVEQIIKSLTFLPVEVFKVLSQDRVFQRLHRVLHDCADDGIQGVFRTFSPAKKSATTRPEFSAPLGAQSSSWTPTDYELEHLVREDGEDDSNWFTDELGRSWVRLGPIPGRWYLTGNRASGVIFWDEDT